MANLQTNRKRYRMLEVYYRGASPPTNFYIYLCTSGSTPTEDTNTLSELELAATGNGYTGPVQLTPGATDFDVLTEDDGSDKAYAQIKDIEWIAAGGPIPASGNPIRYVVKTDDNVTEGSREVLDVWDFGGDIVCPEGSGILLRDLQIDVRKPV